MLWKIEIAKEEKRNITVLVFRFCALLESYDVRLKDFSFIRVLLENSLPSLTLWSYSILPIVFFRIYRVIEYRKSWCRLARVCSSLVKSVWTLTPLMK